MNSNAILYAVIKENRGDWEKVYEHIKTKKPCKDYKDNIDDNFVSILDPRYPEILKNCPNPSFGLFYEGNYSLIQGQNILYIGDEANSNENIDRILNKNTSNRTIITNLNSFSDYDVVKKAINNGNNVILVASDSLNGIKDFNPKLRETILENQGLILSEFPFILDVNETEKAVNRSQMLTAALSNQIVLLEASKSTSNASKILNLGINLGKDLFVFPSKNLDSYNYELIKAGAPLITKAQDLDRDLTNDMEL